MSDILAYFDLDVLRYAIPHRLQFVARYIANANACSINVNRRQCNYTSNATDGDDGS